jgi:hypothetical protein
LAALHQNGVAAKLAVEILMCLEQRDLDALARKEQGQDNPSRPAARDAALDVQRILASL